MNVVLKNGVLVPKEQACISMMHPVVQFGEAIFTTARVYRKKIEFPELHFQRLAWQAEQLKFKPVDIVEKDIMNLILQTCTDEDVYKLKIIVFQEEARSSYVAFLEPFTIRSAETFSLMSMQGHMPMTAKIKTICCLDKKMCKEVALTQGFDDMLFLDANRLVLETSCANIFWKVDRTIYAPKRELPLLWGVSLSAIEQWVHRHNYTFQEVEVAIDALPQQAHYYVSNVMIWFKPVVAINKMRFERDISFEKELRYLYL